MLSLVSKRLIATATGSNSAVLRTSLPITVRFQSTFTATPSSSSSSTSSSSSSAAAAPAANTANLEEEYKSEVADILTEYENRQKRRQAKIGTVVSTKNAKTISVEIEYQRYFPKYDTYLRRTRKIMAHDEEEQASKGDIVRIVPCRPRSAMKRHALIDIIRKHTAAIDDATPAEPAAAEKK